MRMKKMSMKIQQFLAVLFVAGNLGGVFPIVGQSGVYRPHQFAQWLSAIQMHPTHHMISAMLFWVGAGAGVFLGLWFCRHQQWKVGSLFALASFWNWCWTPVPLLLAMLSESNLGNAHLWLGMALFADAIFNGLLGLSMMFLGWNLRTQFPKIGYSGMLIGTATIFVMGQFYFEICANFLGVAGPLWLGWWLLWAVYQPQLSNGLKE